MVVKVGLFEINIHLWFFFFFFSKPGLADEWRHDCRGSTPCSRTRSQSERSVRELAVRHFRILIFFCWRTRLNPMAGVCSRLPAYRHRREWSRDSDSGDTMTGGRIPWAGKNKNKLKWGQEPLGTRLGKSERVQLKHKRQN